MTHTYEHVTQMVTPREAAKIVQARGALSHDMRRLLSQPFNLRLANEAKGEYTSYNGAERKVVQGYLDAYDKGGFDAQLTFCTTYWDKVLMLFPEKTVPKEPFKNRPLFFIAVHHAMFPEALGAAVYAHLLRYKLPRNLFKESAGKTSEAA